MWALGAGEHRVGRSEQLWVRVGARGLAGQPRERDGLGGVSAAERDRGRRAGVGDDALQRRLARAERRGPARGAELQRPGSVEQAGELASGHGPHGLGRVPGRARGAQQEQRREAARRVRQVARVQDPGRVGPTS
jgi:hypothetical protein